jgi:hypothetical protein
MIEISDDMLIKHGSKRAKATENTHCKAGHELTGENVYMSGNRQRCKQCKREYNAKYRNNQETFSITKG